MPRLLLALALSLCMLAGSGAFVHAASAATPQQICADLADGHLDGSYSQADMDAFVSDPTVQGYGCGGTTPPPSTTPVATTPSTPTPVPAPVVDVCGEGTVPVPGSGALAPSDQVPTGTTTQPAPAEDCRTPTPTSPTTVYVCATGTTPIAGTGALASGDQVPAGAEAQPAPAEDCSSALPITGSVVYVCAAGTTPIAGTGALAPTDQVPSGATVQPAPASDCVKPAPQTVAYVCATGTPVKGTGAVSPGEVPAGAKVVPAPAGDCRNAVVPLPVLPSAPETAVLGAMHSGTTGSPSSSSKPRSGVEGAKATSSPVTPKQHQLAGVLPFTGADLTVFVLVALGLIGLGALLRQTAHNDDRD